MSLGAPFTDPKPLGWSLFEVLTSAQMSAVNANAAAAADGSAWSDVSILKNWKYATPGLPNPMSQRTLLYDAPSRRWMVLGGNTATGEYTYNGSKYFLINSGNFGDLSPLMVHATAAASNGMGVILAGGDLASAGTGHLKESTDGGVTWPTVRSLGTSDTNATAALAWVPSLGLWLASQGAPTIGGIYSSSDRATWTLRGGAGSPPTHFVVRNSPSPIVIATTLQIVGGSLNYFRSTDGITWTTIAFPSGVGNTTSQGCWSDALGFFYVGGAGGIYRSADASSTASWSLIDSTWSGAATTAASIASFGRLLMRGDGKASFDGASWFKVLDTENTDLFIASSPVGMAAARASSVEVYVSQMIGN